MSEIDYILFFKSRFGPRKPAMNLLSRIFRVGVIIPMIFCLLQEAVVFAENSAASEESSEQSYVLPYIVVLFVFAFAIGAVVRSGNRADRPKMVEKDLEYRLEKMSGRPKDR